jgi:ABC-type oligopeptide transport system substrate-binding subunit
MPGFQDVVIYPLTPDLRRARPLVGDRQPRSGVLYACNLPFCARQAAIVARNLRKIGIGLAVRQFAIPELIERLGRRDEPYDVAISPGWFADFLDPAQYLNFLLDGRTIRAEQNVNFAYFADQAYVRKLARIETLTGVRRVLAYGELDVETARDSAPLIAYANATSLDLFSERVGCQAYNPAYGMSLAALCLRKASG